MQKKFLFIAFSLCIFCFCERKTIKTDTQLLELQGKVKQITCTDLTIGGVMGGEKTIYFKGSEIISYFDETGKHIKDEKTFFSVSSDLVAVVYYTFKHCPKGQKLESYMSVEGEKPFLSKKYSYNRKGFLHEETTYDGYGNIELETIYKYDETGRMIEKITTTASGSPSSSIIYIYDQGNHPIEEHITRIDPFYSIEDKVKYIYTYEYDDIGNWIEKTAYSGYGIGEPFAQYRIIREIEYYP
jgi:hypothetical protein